MTFWHVAAAIFGLGLFLWLLECVGRAWDEMQEKDDE